MCLKDAVTHAINVNVLAIRINSLSDCIFQKHVEMLFTVLVRVSEHCKLHSFDDVKTPFCFSEWLRILLAAIGWKVPTQGLESRALLSGRGLSVSVYSWRDTNLEVTNIGDRTIKNTFCSMLLHSYQQLSNKSTLIKIHSLLCLDTASQWFW